MIKSAFFCTSQKNMKYVDFVYENTDWLNTQATHAESQSMAST